MKKPMNLAEALAKIEETFKGKATDKPSDWQPQTKHTRQESQALYNFMRGMP